MAQSTGKFELIRTLFVSYQQGKVLFASLRFLIQFFFNISEGNGEFICDVTTSEPYNYD